MTVKKKCSEPVPSGITGFQCGECKTIFADPDECMIHAINNHPRMENENTQTEDELEYRPL